MAIIVTLPYEYIFIIYCINMKKSRRNTKKSRSNSTGGSTSKKRKRKSPNSAQQYIGDTEVQNIIRILEEKGMTYHKYPVFF